MTESQLAYRKQVGSALRRARMDRKLTQVQVAAELGISKDYISVIERGRNLPDVRRLRSWAAVVGLPWPQWLG